MILCKIRKIFAVVFAAAVVLTFNACGNKNVTEKEYTANLFGDDISGLYTGEWSNNMPNGEGTFKGSSYTEDDIYQYNDQISFTGNWVNGKPNNGKYEAFNITESDYSKSEIHTYYEGEWKDGYLDGEGSCNSTFKYREEFSRTEDSGTFSKGELSGQGKRVELNSDGNTYIYEGAFENGKILNGTAHVDFTDGQKLDFNGSFSDGEAWNGTAIATLKNGTTIQTTYTNGEPEEKGFWESLGDLGKVGFDFIKPWL